jgi:hypothetical protein
LLLPTMPGVKDHSDLWFAYSYEIRAHPAKRVMHRAFQALSWMTRTPVAPELSLAFEKIS